MTQGADPIVTAFDRLAAADPRARLVVSTSASADVEGVAAAARAASRVAGDSVPPRSLVGLSAPNGVAFLAGLLALRRAGAVVVLLDAGAPEADQRRACAALGARAILTCATAWPQGPADWRRLAVDDALEPRLPEGDAAFVKLTSGTTATPRGVAASAEAILADDAALARSMGLVAGDRIVGAIPLSHSYGFVSVAVPALVRGSPVVLPAESGPLSALAAAREAQATVFPTAPAYLQALLKMSRPPEWPASVRLVLSAGAPLSAEVAARFRETYGRAVHVFYGASECGGICYDREGGAAERGTVGAPVDGVHVALEPVEGGVEGEGVVTVFSDAVAAGYLPEPDPHLGRGRFQAGDLARWDGGEMRLRGRVDGVINVKGKKVSPSEIESVLARLAGVEEAVAFGVPAPDLGSDVLRAVVACPSGSLSYHEVVAWCRRHLPDHKVPRSVVLVSALPRTSRGKLDRAGLLALGPGESA
jgi:long-chain acyl-CoA synthetase